ncbi:MAG TPA: MOSC N-terminal beta barrel domain-containing protein [Longimicrobiaceae bacterium]|nr:MOSC N-terminal beta barrel domain-containing protein [Longimicrobiaceae bacterium]
MRIGRVREIWRFPVKSMAGERLAGAALGPLGIPGDRGWALRDDEAGEIRGAKKWPALMQCAARYRREPDGRGVPPVDITLPDGSRTASDDPEVDARLSALVGSRVSLWPLQPAADRQHYRRVPLAPALLVRLGQVRALRPLIPLFIKLGRLEPRLRELLGREPEEPLPDFGILPPELFEYTSPPGTYFDAYPVHLLTTASLAAMARLHPAAAWDARRFRPNFLVEAEVGVEGLVEAEWSGRTVRLGEAALRCEIPTVRCGMTTHAQDGLPKDPSVLRAIVRDADQNLGTYARVARPGRVAVGDAVELV